MTRNWQSIKMGHVVTSVSGDLCGLLSAVTGPSVNGSTTGQGEARRERKQDPKGRMRKEGARRVGW